MNSAKWKYLLILFLLFGVACQENPAESPGKMSEAKQKHGHEADEHDHEPSGQQDEQDQHGDTHEHEGEAHSGDITIASEALEGQTFQTVLAQWRLVKEGIQATANIKPNEYKLTHVSPRIEGKAVKVIAELGDTVKPGQTLALLDSIELGYKKSAFLQARTNVQVDRKNYEREKRLFEQQISSEKDFLEAQGAFQRNQAAYQAAYEALELVGLPHEEIGNLIKNPKHHHPLSLFPLTAPQKGTIISRHINPGEFVTPKDKPFTIADLRTVWILLDIYERDLAGVRVSAHVRITVDAYPGEIFRGAVVYLGNLVNPDTRTVEARVEIPNPDGRLRPGMFARATIVSSLSKGKKVLVVPQDAIQHIEGKPVAFVEEQPGRYERRMVTLGSEDDPYVEILDGLTEGERIVTQGSFYLKSIMLGEKLGGHSH